MTYRVRSTDIWHSMPGVVAAYQPIGAPSEIEARFNIGAWQRMVGNYTATPGTAPSWSAQTGWGFVGFGAGAYWLDTGLLIPNNTYSALVRFSAVSGENNTLLGSYNTSSGMVLVLQVYAGATNILRYYNGSSSSVLSVAPGITSGVMGVAGKTAYRNGVADGSIPAGTGANGYTVNIGRYNYSSPGGWLTGKIQSVLIVSRTLTPAEVWQASMQMAYCDSNPAWNAWAPRKRYFIPVSVAAGAVGIYGARATMALPGGVSIRATGGQT